MRDDPNKKKIQVRVWPQVSAAIKRDLRDLHVKRDSYLNSLMRSEVENLAVEIDFRTPDEARSAIKRHLLAKTPDFLTLLLDKTVVNRMDQVLDQKNISRNAFVNRVLFFLVAKPAHLRGLGIKYETRSESLVKPLDEAWSNLQDPFFNIRSANNEKFYAIVIAEPWFGLNCAISQGEWEEVNAPRIELEDLV